MAKTVVKEPEDQNALEQGIQDYEEEMLHMQTHLADLRKQELFIRQSLRDMEQKKDPGAYLFKPICNWNLDEERRLKERRKRIVEETAEQKTHLKKRIQQRDLLIQIRNQMREEQKTTPEPMDQNMIQKEHGDREEERSKQEKNLRYILNDIVAQLQYMKKYETLSAEDREKEVKQRGQHFEQWRKNFRLLESNLEEQVKGLMELWIQNDEDKKDDQITLNSVIEIMQWKLKKREYDPNQVFHVKHLISQENKEEKKMGYSQMTLLYSVLDFCINELASHREEKGKIELSISETKIELYVEYTLNAADQNEQFERNNTERLEKLRAVYEQRVRQCQGEIVAADHCILIEMPLSR